MTAKSKLRMAALAAVLGACALMLGLFLRARREPAFAGKAATAWVEELAYELSGRVGFIQTQATARGQSNFVVWISLQAQAPSSVSVTVPDGPQSQVLSQTIAHSLVLMGRQVLTAPYAGPTGSIRVVSVPLPPGAGTNRPSTNFPVLVRPAGAKSVSPLEAVKALGAEAVPSLIGALQARGSKWKQRYAWLYLKLPPAVQSGLPIPSPPALHVRRAAMTALGELGRPAEPAVPLLVEALNSSDQSVRSAALSALGKLRHTSQQAQTALEGQLPGLSSAEGVRWIRNHDLRGPPARELLRRVLKESSFRLKAEVAFLLETWGPDAAWAVPNLALALQDPHEDVRYFAARALGSIGPAAKAATPDLTRALEEASEIVRRAAQRSLERLGSEASGP